MSVYASASARPSPRRQRSTSHASSTSTLRALACSRCSTRRSASTHACMGSRSPRRTSLRDSPRRSTSSANASAAAGVRAAVAARVARAGTDHAAAAAGALDCVFPRVEECGLPWRGRLARLRRRDRGLAARLVPLREPRLHLGRDDPDLLLLLGGQEALA